MERVFISRLLLVVFLLHAAPSHTEEHVSPKPSVVQAERVRREAEKLRLSKDHDAALKLFEEVRVCMRVCSRVSVRSSLFFHVVSIYVMAFLSTFLLGHLCSSVGYSAQWKA